MASNDRLLKLIERLRGVANALDAIVYDYGGSVQPVDFIALRDMQHDLEAMALRAMPKHEHQWLVNRMFARPSVAEVETNWKCSVAECREVRIITQSVKTPEE